MVGGLLTGSEKCLIKSLSKGLLIVDSYNRDHMDKKG